MKIDVEGHEHAVLEGAKALLDRCQPVVIMEYTPIPEKFVPPSIERLQERGYAVFDGKTLQRVSPGYIPEDRTTHTDLFGIPAAKKDYFAALARKL